MNVVYVGTGLRFYGFTLVQVYVGTGLRWYRFTLASFYVGTLSSFTLVRFYVVYVVYVVYVGTGLRWYGFTVEAGDGVTLRGC